MGSNYWREKARERHAAKLRPPSEYTYAEKLVLVAAPCNVMIWLPENDARIVKTRDPVKCTAYYSRS